MMLKKKIKNKTMKKKSIENIVKIEDVSETT